MDPRTQLPPHDYTDIYGPLPPHRCREALQALLREQTGLEFPDLREASGEYGYHILDGKAVVMRCWVPADVCRTVIQELSHGCYFEGGLATDYRWWRDKAKEVQGTLYVFWVPDHDEDSKQKYWESWRIILRDGGADLEYTDSYNDV